MDGAAKQIERVDHSSSDPLNREPILKDLISSFLTPTTLPPYDRNHGGIPHLNVQIHTVTITGLGIATPLTLSPSDLATRFPQHSVTCAVACAGNRRHTMRTLLKEVQGINWFDGAVMNCTWTGPLLKDVLKAAGLNEVKDDWHVCFSSHAVPCQEDNWYGASITLSRALRADAEVVLALRMNGEPLPVRNGAPVRVIVPGIIGARCVKWLDRITVSKGESENFYQRRDYKILPPEAVDKESAERFWESTPPMMDLPLNSVVAVPAEGDVLRLDENREVEARGYAMPRGEQGPIVKIEVSGDEGRTWVEAKILRDGDVQGKRSKWAWVLWIAKVRVEKGEKKRIVSRAMDWGGNTQTERSQWNLRGVGYNGYGEVGGLRIL